jgi:hypothetical protein
MSDDQTDDLIGYGDWGALFFQTAVTEERILAGVNAMAGRPINVGPLGVGPGRVAKVMAKGEIGTATGHRISTDPVAFDVRLPVTLNFSLDLSVDVQKFVAVVEIPLRLTARARDDLAIFIDVRPPRADEVKIVLKAKSLRATLTQYAAGIEGELQRFIAKYVAREINSPGVVAARTINVGGAVSKAAGGIVPS